MDLLGGNIKTTYFRYLGAAFGSAMIGSIYSLVDMAMVGQYQGPAGTAALAVVAPVWNVLYSLGLLTGIGGSVLFAAERGRGERARGDGYFTAALAATVVLALICWAGLFLWEEPLLRLFGGEGALIDLATTYLRPIKWVAPVFLFNQMLSAFLRNDDRPALTTGAVLAGGICNVFGDWFCIFHLDMGIYGAGLATAVGAVVTLLVLLSHFFTKGNTLRLRRPRRWLLSVGRLGATGFSTFFVDVAMGILTMLFNRQIMHYLGGDALAVYGVIVNISTIVQCCAYSVGQAAQPFLSQNYGAGQWGRIREILRWALGTVAFFSVVWTVAVVARPLLWVRIFMAPTPAILTIAPPILRGYALSFLLLPLNIFATYYFQSLLKPWAGLGVSVARGLVISGGLILLLPVLGGGGALWFAMPLTEGVVALGVVVLMVKFTRELGKKGAVSRVEGPPSTK